MVVEHRFEDLVDDGFRVLAAWLERLRHLVEQEPAAGAVGRNDRDPAIADEGPHLVGRVGEETVSVMTHPVKYGAAVPWLASVMS